MALACSALVYLTLLKLGATNNYVYVLFSFFSTVVGYNFVKYLQVSNLYYRQLTRSMKSIRLFTIASVLGVLYFFLQLSFITLFWVLLPFVALTILYAVPLLPKNRNLRSVARGKIFIIAIVWAGISVVVPVCYIEGFLNFDFLLESLQRFLFVLVLMLPFEIRDLPYDNDTLQTIPQLIGIRKTKIVGSFILVLFCMLSFAKDDVTQIEMISTITISLVMLLFLWRSDSVQPDYYCSFWVESIPIMWLLIFLGSKVLFT